MTWALLLFCRSASGVSETRMEGSEGRVCVSRECHEGLMQIAEREKAGMSGSTAPLGLCGSATLAVLGSMQPVKWDPCRVAFWLG